MSEATTTASRTAVALVTDLMFRAQIREIATVGQLAVTFVRTADELRSLLATSDARLVIVDLNCKGGEGLAGARVAAELIPQRVIAFLSHVDEALNAQASALGIEVMARSRFVKRLPELLGVASL